MTDSNVLDKALNIVAGFQKDREDRRSNFMRTILPEVLQPEELKQAAAPMKEESTKSLHATKYDRRMKFNTALDRSTNSTTREEPKKPKEDPLWMKEAAKRAFDTSSFDGSGVTGREGVITVEDELLKTPPLPTEDPPEYDVGNKPVMQKASAAMTAAHPSLAEPFSLAEPSGWEKAGPAIGGTLMGITLPAMGLVDSQITPKGLGILGLGGLGLGLGTYGLLRRSQRKHREKAQEFVNNLNQIAALPKTAEDLYPQASSGYPEESFTQRHPYALPILLGLGGAAAGAVPSAWLGGRAAVNSVTKAYQKNLNEAETAYKAAIKFHARKGQAPSNVDRILREELLKRTRSKYKNLKDSAPEPGYHRALGQAGGGLLGGFTGGGLGTLGGLAINKPQPWE